MQHFIGRYSRYSRYRTKTHDKATISNDITRYSRYQTALLKLEEITSRLYRFVRTSFAATAISEVEGLRIVSYLDVTGEKVEF